MRINSLKVRNLKALRSFEISELTNFVVLAGQNGSGKSCVLDAIRLLKSVYGGHSQDEHMQWFGEFAINLADRNSLRQVFRDPNESLHISATIEFAESERVYLAENVRALAWPIAWQRATGQRVDPWSFSQIAVVSQLAQFQPVVEQIVQEISKELAVEFARSPSQQLELEITPDGSISASKCLAAEVSFQSYEPDHLGIIEYHSASRAYTRQPLQEIRLDSRSFEDQRRQQRLYNWQAKYQNVKTELASSYLRGLVAEKTGSAPEANGLDETLEELFTTFFPDKSYEGVRPRPDGSLEFPVKLADGAVHDIDEMSSGEKEILYGYLRLRNSTPKNSVILLDEPELHLNPSLLQGFADFYHRNLGVANENQLWLVTHSDTLLRQAIGNTEYRVFHLVNATGTEGNQASEILLDDDVERVVIDLVGDLAGYQPHAKVVVIEGKEEDGFDEQLLRRFFPELSKRTNLVSARSKRRVQLLYDTLVTTVGSIAGSNRFFAITDQDFDDENRPEEEHLYSWDAYHIENYLLSPVGIRHAAADLHGHEVFSSDADVLEALKQQAIGLVDRLVLEKVQASVNQRIVGSIQIGAAPNTNDVAADLLPSVVASGERVATAVDEITADSLAELVAGARKRFEDDLDNGLWIKTFPGRLILKGFISEHVAGAKYEYFRNLVAEKILFHEGPPAEMRAVVDEILAA